MIYDIAPSGFSPRFHVVNCIIESDGMLLLLHRQGHKPQGGTWCLPGGKVDADETPLQAIVREVHEETGIILDALALSLVRSVPAHHSDYDFMYDLFFTRCKTRPGVMVNAAEHREYRWVIPHDVLSFPLIEDGAPCLRFVYKV